MVLASYVKMIIAAFLWGGISFGGRVMGDAGFSLLEVMVFPSLVNIIMLFWFARKDFGRFFKFPLLLSIIFPISIIVTQVGQYAPLFLGLSVSLTVLIAYLQPLWTLLINVVFLKARFEKKDAVLVLLMLAGLVMLVSPWEGFKFSTWGFIIALMAGIGISVWIITMAEYSKLGAKPQVPLFFNAFYGTMPFVLFYPLISHAFPDASISAFSLDHPPQYFIYAFVYGACVFVLSQLLLYSAAKKINSIHIGLVALLEPVVAVVLDISFLDTVITWNILAGGALILAANAYLIIKSSNHEIKE